MSVAQQLEAEFEKWQGEQQADDISLVWLSVCKKTHQITLLLGGLDELKVTYPSKYVGRSDKLVISSWRSLRLIISQRFSSSIKSLQPWILTVNSVLSSKPHSFAEALSLAVSTPLLCVVANIERRPAHVHTQEAENEFGADLDMDAESGNRTFSCFAWLF